MTRAIVSLRVPLRVDADRTAGIVLLRSLVPRCQGLSHVRFEGEELCFETNGKVSADFGERFHAACLVLEPFARVGFHSEFTDPEASTDDDMSAVTFFGPTPAHKRGHEIDWRVAQALQMLELTGKTVVADELASHMREALDYPSPEQMKPILPAAAGVAVEPSAEAYEAEARSNGFGIDQSANGRWEYFFQNGDGRGFNCPESKPIYASEAEAWKAACVDNDFMVSSECEEEIVPAPGASS